MTLRKLMGEPSNGLDSLVVPDALPRGKLVARYETDIQERHICYLNPLKSWCATQQINYGAFMENLKTKLGAKRGKVRLGKGTHLNLPPSDVIIVNCRLFTDDPRR